MLRWLLNRIIPTTAVVADYRHPLGGHHGYDPVRWKMHKVRAVMDASPVWSAVTPR